MSSKVFVTGASGFIGSHLIPKLVERGYEAVCLVREPERAAGLTSQGARLVKGDLTSADAIRGAMEGADAVFHLAGWYAVGVRDAQRMQAINVEGARTVLEMAAELGVPKILHTSTVGVFGNTHGQLVDESYRAPKAEMTSSYEQTKWEAHYEVAEPLQRRGTPVIILQPGGVTGAGDQSPHVMVFDMFLHRTPVMLGARSGLTFAHVDDIAEGCILAFERGKPGESYILAGEALTYRKVFEICEKITGIHATNAWLPGWGAAGLSGMAGLMERMGMQMAFSSEALAAMNDYTYWASADKAARELGWTRRATEETLKDILAYLQTTR
ncbi:MAG TPA: NAD-dependent epimerase/dehydratase family protein [Anaerolineales bacterium]|nr:NAD-dependent epimerase/dehydratase family protein [Anaerolineales bacterium]